jgi:hypothetical protein
MPQPPPPPPTHQLHLGVLDLVTCGSTTLARCKTAVPSFAQPEQAAPLAHRPPSRAGRTAGPARHAGQRCPGRGPAAPPTLVQDHGVPAEVVPVLRRAPQQQGVAAAPRGVHQLVRVMQHCGCGVRGAGGVARVRHCCCCCSGGGGSWHQARQMAWSPGAAHGRWPGPPELRTFSRSSISRHHQAARCARRAAGAAAGRGGVRCPPMP